MGLNGLGVARAARRERRHAVRRKVQSLVYLKIAPDNGGVLHDLGENGMRVSLANPLCADTECRFSIIRQNHPTIQGVGRVAWISKSGKAAGLRFVELPGESHEQIRRWLGSATDDGETAGNRKGLGNNQKEMADVSLPASEETKPPAENSEAAEMKLRTPLFFFPQREMEDLPGRDTAEAEDAIHPTGNQPDDLEEMRVALTQKQDEQEIKKHKRREILFAVQLTCVATLVLAGGLLFIYKGNYAYQYVKSHAPISLAFGHTRSVEPPPSKAAHARRPRRRSRPSAREAAAGGSSSTPAIWKAPEGKVPFQLEVTDSFNRRWLITASGQKMLSAGQSHAGKIGASTDTQLETQSSAALDESAGVTEPSGDSAGPVQTSVREGRAIEPETVVAPKLEKSRRNAPFAVVLDALIGPDGSVKNIHVVSSPSAALAWAVVEAVKQWHYPPFYRGGHPAEVVTRITVAFKGNPPKK
jgi:TonB family protein